MHIHELNKYKDIFKKIQGALEYRLNMNDYTVMIPELTGFIKTFNNAGGTWPQLWGICMVLGTMGQKDNLKPVLEETYTKITGKSTVSITGFNRVLPVPETAWPSKRSEGLPEIPTLESFLIDSDAWAEYLDEFQYTYLPEDMEQKLQKYFIAGGTPGLFNNAFMFGDENDEADYVYEYIEDLFRLTVPRELWV